MDIMSEENPNNKERKNKETKKVNIDDPVNKLLYSYPLGTKWKKGLKKHNSK